MKNYRVIIAKEVVAQVSMSYEEFLIKYHTTDKFVEWIQSTRPELKDCPYIRDFVEDDVVVKFMSAGNPVMQEIQ